MKKESLAAVCNIKTDHKSIFIPQGDNLGTLSRLTWMGPKTQANSKSENKFKSISCFMELDPCDPTKPDKGRKTVAKKMMEFVTQKMNLQGHLSKINFCTDHAIYEGIIKEFELLGFKNLQHRFTVCDSHTGVVEFKSTEESISKHVKKDDSQSKYFYRLWAMFN